MSLCGPGFDSLDAATLDTDGTLLIAGSFDRELRLGHGAAQRRLAGLPSTPPHSAHDLYVLRLDSWGSVIGDFVATAPDGVFVGGLLAVEGGDVILAGRLGGPARFGSRVVDPASERGPGDGYVARIGADGGLRWMRLLRAGGDASVEALAPAPGGDIYAVGQFGGELDLGVPEQRVRAHRPPNAAPDPLRWDVFAARLSGDGELRWLRSAGGPYQDTVRSAAALSDGGLVLTGSCRERTVASDQRGRLSLDCGHLAISVLLLAYDPEGDLRFAQRFRGDGDYPEGVAVDGLPDGGVVLAGHMQRRMRFPRPGGDLVLQSAGLDGWVARLDGRGKLRWARRLGAARPVVVQALRGLADGDLLVAGDAEGGFDLRPEEADRFQAGRGPLFVARLDGEGALRAGRSVGQGLDDPPREPGQWYAATALGRRADGAIWLAGIFAGTASFPWAGGPRQRACYEQPNMLNAHDAFVLLAPPLLPATLRSEANGPGSTPAAGK